jgi:hypothetical protein
MYICIVLITHMIGFPTFDPTIPNAKTWTAIFKNYPSIQRELGRCY